MTDLFRQLPQEVVSLVVDDISDKQDLYQCALINKHFYALASAKLWYSPGSTLNSDNLLATASPILRSLLLYPHLGVHVRQLEFQSQEAVSDILSVLAYTPLVNDLTLQQTQMSDIDMTRIAHLCPDLQRLSLASVEGITDAALQALSGVIQLDLFWCHNLTFQALPPSLEQLDIRGCHALSQTMIGSLNRLTHLNISSIDDDALASFIDRLLLQPDALPALKSFLINCYDCGKTRLDDGVMIPFIEAHPLLRGLSLGHAWIGHGSLAAMAKCLPELRMLYLDHNKPVSFLDMQRVILGCPLLIHVSLYRCRLLDYDGSAVDELDLHDIARLRRGLALVDVVD